MRIQQFSRRCVRFYTYRTARLPSLPCMRQLTRSAFAPLVHSTHRTFSSTTATPSSNSHNNKTNNSNSHTNNSNNHISSNNHNGAIFQYRTRQENQDSVSAYITQHLQTDQVAMITFLDNAFNCALLLHQAETQVPLAHVVAMLQQCTELFPVAEQQQQQQQSNSQVSRERYLDALASICAQADRFAREKSIHAGLLVRALCTQYCGEFEAALTVFEQLRDESARTGESKFEYFALCASATIQFSISGRRAAELNQQQQQEAGQQQSIQQEQQSGKQQVGQHSRDGADTGKAFDIVQRAIELLPELSYGYQLKALFHANAEQFVPATELLDSAIQRDPQNWTLYTLRGHMLTALGKLKDALHDFMYAVKLQPSAPEARIPLSIHYTVHWNDLTNGLVELDTALIMSSSSRSSTTQNSVQNILISHVDHFLETVKGHPRAETITLLVQGILGTRVADMQRSALSHEKRVEFLKQNMESYDQAVLNEPQMPEALFFRALAKSELPELENALADLNKAIEMKPDFYQAYSLRATMIAMEFLTNEQQLRERLCDMLADFEKAENIAPDYYDVYWNRSTLFVVLKQGEEALKDVNKAIALRPMYSSTQYYKRAHVHLMLDKPKEALEDYGVAIELHPDAPHLYKERAQLYRTRFNNEAEAQRDEQMSQQLQTRLQQYYAAQQQTTPPSKQ